METAILYLVFNRLESVKKSFEPIKIIAPKRLYVSADGPRDTHDEDKEKCAKVRQYIKEHVNWNCEVHYLYRDLNLGCGKAVSEAIDWFFDKEDEGIIIEDDCVPDLSFFKFCEELLNRYRNHKNIFQIAGSNWQKGIKRGAADYYFSYISSVWGWATWRDRWDLYRYTIDLYSEDYMKMTSNLKQIALNQREVYYHLNCFEKTASGLLDTWDYQWRYLMFLNRGKNIVPNCNLISNVGFGEEGTHTLNSEHWRSKLKAKELNFPLKHPKSLSVNKKADGFLAKHIWLAHNKNNDNYIKQINQKLKKIKHKFYGRT